MGVLRSALWSYLVTLDIRTRFPSDSQQQISLQSVCLLVALILFYVKIHYIIFLVLFVGLFVCLFVYNADPYDYLPPPKEAVLTFQKGNIKSALCKEITIVDDCDAEMLEEFRVELDLVEAECAEVQFHPNYTTVKITDNDTPKGTYQSQHTHPLS